jgi:cellulose synthase/poly-beta-1,6-N-acetylglucosamine synthase-like glycosyltransferase
MSGKFDITFYIKAYDEERFMRSKLESLIPRLKSAKARSEIIVGVQGNDKTYEIARSFMKDFRDLRVYRVKEPGVRNNINFLIDKSRSDILVADDADNLFIGDVDRVVKIFKDPKVGGILQFDIATKEWLNRGHKLFDEIYHEVQLKHHLRGNTVSDPIFSVHIVRKSGLKGPPYTVTYNDDTEYTNELLNAGYKIIYDKELEGYVINSPLQKRITVMGIFKRRTRTEQFRIQARELLNTHKFDIKSRMGEYVEALAITCTRADAEEFVGFVWYTIVTCVATIVGDIKLIGSDMSKWGYIDLRERKKPAE